ncbi:hypothetical protein GQ54DRAFT_297649 [Martensiomyces pterosporus]|nr:hypothetical protein GQ54DRAFT_297649 [Martensiomyces pterosporus]
MRHAKHARRSLLPRTWPAACSHTPRPAPGRGVEQAPSPVHRRRTAGEWPWCQASGFPATPPVAAPTPTPTLSSLSTVACSFATLTIPGKNGPFIGRMRLQHNTDSLFRI